MINVTYYMIEKCKEIEMKINYKRLKCLII